MSKPALTIEQQIQRLKDKKKIIFQNEEQAKKFLAKYGYQNVISLKYLFATGKDTSNNIHIYNSVTSFEEIQKKYLELFELENILRESTLMFEIELKVYLTLFLKKFLWDENISFRELLENKLFVREGEIYQKISEIINDNNKTFLQEIEDAWISNIKDYSGHTDWNMDYYLLFKILSFGKIRMFLNFYYLSDGNIERKTLYPKFKNFCSNNFSLPEPDCLKTINYLRNALCHKESLVTFLDKGYRKNNLEEGKDILRERICAVKFIYNYYQNHLKEKNSSHEKRFLDQGGWIVEFEKYRLQEVVRKNFVDINY